MIMSVDSQRRIAMWSGPRNISTAMMRAWGSRPDTVVCDEPLYANYLKSTGYTHHPDYREILASQNSDWRQVADQLTGPVPDGKTIYFQKHMAQHLLDDMSLDWTDSLTNVFLVRDPREMLLSLLEFFPDPTLEETGLPQQARLFRRIKERTSNTPIVVDAQDVLRDPRSILEQVCHRVDLPFDSRMLKWEPGLHATDGVWAEHWYANVAKSTTFGSYRPKPGEVPTKHQGLLDRCQALYAELVAHRLQP